MRLFCLGRLVDTVYIIQYTVAGRGGELSFILLEVSNRVKHTHVYRQCKYSPPLFSTKRGGVRGKNFPFPSGIWVV